MEEWGFIWLMFAMKVPIVALLWIVWWAVRAKPETASEDDGGNGEGGIGDRHKPPRPRPTPPRRRGPHGSPVAPSPPRVRAPGDRSRPVTR